MRRALVLLALPGCSIGLGGYVGKHAPREHVDIDACLLDDQNRCTDDKQIMSHEPARHFWGAILPFPALGAAQVTDKGKTETTVRGEASLEVLQGYGRYAFGVRAGAILDDHAVAWPIDAMAHLNLNPRFSAYAGAGYAPYAHYVPKHMAHEVSYVNEQVLAGIQIRLQRVLVLSFEGDSTWMGFAGGYHSLGFTGHFGFFY